MHKLSVENRFDPLICMASFFLMKKLVPWSIILKHELEQVALQSSDCARELFKYVK